MPDNFNVIPENRIDVGKIRNFLAAEKIRRARKDMPIVFHILLAVIAACGIYIAVDGINIGLPFLLSVICMCVSPALCVYGYLYSPMPLKIAATFLPALGFALRIAVTSAKVSFAYVACHLFVYILCILLAAVLTKVSLSGYTKSTCFIAVSAVYVIIFLCICVFLFMLVKGSFSIELAVRTLDTYFDNFINYSVSEAGTQERLELFRKVYPDMASVSDEEILSSVRQALEISVTVTKMCLPAIVILTCMLFALVTVEFFSFVAKVLHIDVFICIMDNFWTYRPSIVTTTLYDIVFFVFLIGMFVALPQNVSATVINLLLILTPVMFIHGVKGIYGFIFRKSGSKKNSAIITAIILIACVIVLSTYALFIISSFGVMFVTNRHREETAALPAKLLADNLTFEKLYGADNKDKTSEKEASDNSPE